MDLNNLVGFAGLGLALFGEYRARQAAKRMDERLDAIDRSLKLRGLTLGRDSAGNFTNEVYTYTATIDATMPPPEAHITAEYKPPSS